MSENARVSATEAPAQSARYSMQLIVRDPFERPLRPLRRMSDEGRSCWGGQERDRIVEREALTGCALRW